MTSYRPYYYDRIAAGLDARGKPVAWTHRLVGPSILARWAPPAFKDGIDGDAVDGAVQLVYDIPAIQVEYVRREEPVLHTGFWRGVGVTHNNFVIESFIDELAASSKQDPVAFRRALLASRPGPGLCSTSRQRRPVGESRCRHATGAECP